jgi:hypothetical protein
MARKKHYYIRPTIWWSHPEWQHMVAQTIGEAELEELNINITPETLVKLSAAHQVWLRKHPGYKTYEVLAI